MVITRSRSRAAAAGGVESQTLSTVRDQSSGSRGGRKGRGQKRVVDEEGDAQAQDKIVSNGQSTRSRNVGEKRQAVSPDVTEGPPKMATQRNKTTKTTRKRKEKPNVVESRAESQSGAGNVLRMHEENVGAVVELGSSDNNACLPACESNRSFFSENVEGWKYYGRAVRTDLSDIAEQIRYKNLLWCEIKAISRKMIDLQVEIASADPFDPVKQLKFKVSSYASKLNRATVAVNHFATIHVTAQQNADTYFIFTLDNRDLAEDCEVSVRTLRNACERVFQTVVVRCENKNGYSKYENPKYFDELLADANALEMAVPSPETAISDAMVLSEPDEESR